MRDVVILAALLASVGGCKGDSPSNIDANPAGPRCSKLLFDFCFEEHDCTSGICRNFVDDGFQVCTQPCDAGNPSPDDASGSPATCDANAVCKPAAPNMCHL